MSHAQCVYSKMLLLENNTTIPHPGQARTKKQN